MDLDIESVRSYCLGLPGSITEGFPFGEGALVFKVHGKMFLLASIDERPMTVSVKCDPAKAIELRERYEGVQPAYHMNKTHWNTVTLDGSIPAAEVRAMIDHSHALVVASLSKKLRAGIGAGKRTGRKR